MSAGPAAAVCQHALETILVGDAIVQPHASGEEPSVVDGVVAAPPN